MFQIIRRPTLGEKLEQVSFAINRKEPSMNIVSVADYFSSGVTLDRFRELCASTGVESIHVSIIPGRCGSTFLSHITKRVGFGQGDEVFNGWTEEKLKDWASCDQFDQFLTLLMQESVVDNRLYFQVDPWRLEALLPILPKDFGPFPNVTRYTILLRRNIVAQAISYFNANATGLWHSDQGIVETTSRAMFTEQRIMYWIEHIHTMEKKIVEIFPEGMPDTYYYEDLVASPFETIALFLQRSDFAVRPIMIAEALKDESAPKKIIRDEYAIQYMSVINKYPWLRDALSERSAGIIISPTLERMIVSTDNLERRLME